MNSLKEQFDHIAQKYDAQRQLLIPCFQDFYTACYPLIDCMKQAKTVLDLGAGTGLFSQFIYQRRPELEYTLTDLSSEMLKVGRERFNNANNVHFQALDFAHDLIPGSYDIIISALAVHHLENQEQQRLYHKVFGALNPGGIFINADQVSGRSPLFDDLYKSQWRETVIHSGLEPEAIEKAFERIKLDKFAPLEVQLNMLNEAGFKEVDCIYKNLNFVVFCGVKAG